MIGGFNSGFKAGITKIASETKMPQPKIGNTALNPLMPAKDMMPRKNVGSSATVIEPISDTVKTPMERPGNVQKLPQQPEMQAQARQNRENIDAKNNLTTMPNPTPVSADMANSNKRLADMEKIAAAFDTYGDKEKAKSIRAEIGGFRKGLSPDARYVDRRPNIV